jgi:hypothetical protein
MNVALWTAQLLLAALMLTGAALKFMPIEKLAAMMPWTGQVSPAIVRLLGLIDLLGGAGLILPALLHLQPRLTIWTSLAILALMVCAIVFHISRGEAPVTGLNILVALLAVFIAWGRAKKPVKR